MDIIAIILTIVYVGLALLLVILLPIAVYRNIKTGIRFRQMLSEQVENLRLGRMLSRLGISNKNYLFDQRTHKIKHHINKCASCENTETCDSRLEGEDDVADDVATYCPNAEDLIAIKNASLIDERETT